MYNPLVFAMENHQSQQTIFFCGLPKTEYLWCTTWVTLWQSSLAIGNPLWDGKSPIHVWFFIAMFDYQGVPGTLQIAVYCNVGVPSDELVGKMIPVALVRSNPSRWMSPRTNSWWRAALDLFNSRVGSLFGLIQRFGFLRIIAFQT